MNVNSGLFPRAEIPKLYTFVKVELLVSKSINQIAPSNFIEITKSN